MLPMIIAKPLHIQVAEAQSDADYEREFQQLAKLRDDLDAEIVRTEENIDKAQQFFSQSDEFLRLQQELVKLIDRLEEKQRAKAKETINNLAEQHKDLKTERVEPQKEKSYVRKLYKKLCNLTHPDKTKNKTLLELHPLVHDLYGRGDIRGMEELLVKIKAAGSSFKFNREEARDYLRIKVQEYRSICSQLRMQLAYMQSTPGYSLYKISLGPNPVDTALRGLQQNINRLRKMLEPKPTYYTYYP